MKTRQPQAQTLPACHTPVTEIGACRPRGRFAFSLGSKVGTTCYHKNIACYRQTHTDTKGIQGTGMK